LIARGLERCGLIAEAAALRRRTREMIESHYARWGVFHEFFDDEGVVPPHQLKRKSMCAPEVSWMHQAISDYGWTASCYVDLAFLET